ncbi:MAG TPA: hypothetical protein VK151_01310 [Fluviicola sp.]|nr:hypothetical protein [Fluviicola sp.]
MKQTIFGFLLLLVVQSVAGQKQPAYQESASVFFDEIKAATKKRSDLWNSNLYGAILLVDPQTRQVFANETDAGNSLTLSGKVYSGVLPDSVNIANTSVSWGGKSWAMIMLPLPENKQDRINLLAHELFHKAQPSLGFVLFNTENNHLDQKDGRIYLRLELEALKKALESSSKKQARVHLTNAFIFRKYRHSLYTGSDSTENLLELNEGIAEFTGAMVSGRTAKQATGHFVNGIDSFFTNPTFVRSFAYFTTPVYGYLLSRNNKNWHKEITLKTDLTNYFIAAFNLKLPEDLKGDISALVEYYNGKTIISEETAREEKTKQLIAAYKLKFIEQPHLEVQFVRMNISFDPRNIMPIEDQGTVYPNMRVTDVWGVLTVENGVLMSPNWDKVSLTNPTTSDGRQLTGDGWTLELTQGYRAEKDQSTGNYRLVKE